MQAEAPQRIADGVVEPAQSRAQRRHGIADLRRHTASGMLVTSAYQIGLVGISALRGLVVAAFLTQSDYGLWGIIGLTLWTALGFKTAFGANDKYVQQSDADQEQAFQRAFTVELIFTAVLVPVAAVIVALFAWLTGHSAVLAPGFVLLLLLPSTALQFPIAAFYRRMNYRKQRTLQAVEPLLGAVTMITLAVLGAGYWSFVVGAVLGSWAGAIVALRASPYRLAIRYDRGTLHSYVRFSLPLLVAVVSTLALFQVIILVGAGPLGLAGVGAFTLVGNLVQFTDQADSIVTDTLYPAVCAVSDRIDLLSEAFVKSNRLSLMWAVPFGVGMTLFGADLIRFGLGSRWLAALPLLQIMGIVTAVHHVGYNWSAFVRSRGVTAPIAIAGAAVCLTVIAAGVPLMYADGLVGLGIAFALGEAVALLIRGYIMAHFFHGVHVMKHLLRGFAPTLVAVVPVLGLRALYGTERSPAAAIAVFAAYVLTTIAATAMFEWPLLSEAGGYLVRRRPQLA
jgi:O-antigen/teichoic acid export membrane protein